MECRIPVESTNDLREPGLRALLIVKAKYLIRLALPLLCLVFSVAADARGSSPRRAY
jgi:hypothetical protein